MQTRWRLGRGMILAVMLATGCSEETPQGPTTSDYTKERTALAARKPEAGKAAGPAKGPQAKQKKGSGGAGGTSYAAGGRDYFYDPTGKRDPFRSFQFDDEGKQKDEARTFVPLADFELGQLELSAVIWDHNNPRALILDPGGRSYIVREGSQIGKNNGQVIHIDDNLVLVKETYENFAGERTTKDVELRIRLSQGG
ncbi:MAG: pilus assembly protein PilP [Deltaproteobacteria bacterium]|nr:pilus assembly protein PilP [Deltaproteobacteria bacterium]